MTACEIGRRPIDAVPPPATRPCATPCAAGSTSTSSWQGSWPPPVLRQQFQATYDSLRPPLDGVPIHRLRRLLQWPRERFDTVLEALRAAQAVDLEALTEQDVDAQVTHDSYHVHGQCYGRLRWRA